MQEKIDLETFRRLCSAVDIAFIEDLKTLIRDKNNQICWNNLIRSGLAEISPTGVILDGYGAVNIITRISQLGQLFIKLMNENK